MVPISAMAGNFVVQMRGNILKFNMNRLLSIFLFFIGLQTFAQTTIKGIVKDQQGEPLPGVNIMIRDSYDGTSSGIDGTFSFVTEEKGSRILVATFVGYKTVEQTVELKGGTIELTIQLKEEINQLDAVVISAGSFTAGEEKRRTILKAVDIASTAGATPDIAGALNTLPGTQKVGESGRLFVRGGDGNETRTFIDGLVVLDAYGPAAPNTPSRGRFLPFMFKGTSFSTGGYSSEYGQALSSALVLNSKDKADMNQTDIGLLSVGADIAHTQVWDKASWSGKVQYTDIRPYFGLINQRVDWRTPPVSLEGSTAYRQQVGKGMLKFYGNFNRSSFSLYNHDILQPEIKQQFDLVNSYRYGNLSYKSPLSDRWSVRGGLSYSFNENDITIERNELLEKEEGVHGKLVAEHSLTDQLELRIGAETIARDYVAARDSELIGQQSQKFQEWLSSTFAEAEWLFSKKLVAKAGLRGEHQSLLNQISVDPRVSIAYKPGKKGQFSLAYGSFQQTVRNEYLRVNTKLDQERAEHFIANYQIITDRKTFRIETYYKKYDRLVKQISPGLLNSDGHGYAQGVDVFWRDNETFRNVDYWISYSFLDTKRDYLNFPSSSVPTFASKHNFSFVYKHFISKIKSQVGFTYSYSSGRPYYNPNLNSDSFHSQRTPSYQDLSANISYLPKNWMIIHFSCTNILGRDNIFGYQYSDQPNPAGEYVSRPVRQPAARFIFLGVFFTISQSKTVNQLPNL